MNTEQTSSTMRDFQAAEREYETARKAWNALPDPDARRASGIELTALDNAASTAAKAFVAEAAERHKIEERSVVYLVLGPHGWQIDPATFGSGGLEGYDGGPLNEVCEHDGDDDAVNDECEALKSAAAMLQLPDGEQLAWLMSSANTTPEMQAVRLKRALDIIRLRQPEAAYARLETSDQHEYGFSLNALLNDQFEVVAEVDTDLQNEVWDFICDLDWNGVVGEDKHGYAILDLRPEPVTSTKA